MNADAVKDIAIEALEDLKGKDIKCIGIGEISTIADYMIVATGTSSRHVKSLSEEVVKKAKEAGAAVNGTEGQGQSEWVLIDLGDVIVHVMLEETRSLYDLESLWSMSPGISE